MSREVSTHLEQFQPSTSLTKYLFKENSSLLSILFLALKWLYLSLSVYRQFAASTNCDNFWLSLFEKNFRTKIFERFKSIIGNNLTSANSNLKSSLLKRSLSDSSMWKIFKNFCANKKDICLIGEGEGETSEQLQRWYPIKQIDFERLNWLETSEILHRTSYNLWLEWDLWSREEACFYFWGSFLIFTVFSFRLNAAKTKFHPIYLDESQKQRLLCCRSSTRRRSIFKEWEARAEIWLKLFRLCWIRS